MFQNGLNTIEDTALFMYALYKGGYLWNIDDDIETTVFTNRRRPEPTPAQIAQLRIFQDKIWEINPDPHEYLQQILTAQIY